jgi:hypothetical protein
VKSWIENSEGKIENKTGIDLAFDKPEDDKIIQSHNSNDMLKLATDDTLFICCEIQHEGPMIEEPIRREPISQEPISEEQISQDSMNEDPTNEEPMIEEPMIEEPMIEKPMNEEPMNEEPMNEEPTSEGPMIEAVKHDSEDTEQEAYRNKVGQTMLELHSNGYSDVIIQVKNKEFKTSKVILMVHSDVFKRMLSRPNSTEAQTGIIKIKDAKPKVIKALIRWMYQVEIPNMNKVANDLYRVADKYEIDFLKKQCVKAMIEGLSNKNLLSRLILAYKYSEEQLKQGILTFLREDSKNLQSLMASDEWLNFAVEYPDMREGILADIFESLY